MTGFALVLALLFGPQAETTGVAATAIPPPAPVQPAPTPLDPVAVTADEPRFVAPTRRDRIGRIWAPVTINGKGPFRLVL
ncbi:MAG TPA: hypothetical protein VIB01_09885, partial [Steroidobacteraceae bacterium]